MEVVVSSVEKEIWNIVEKFGEYVIDRPAQLAGDKITHSMSHLFAHKKTYYTYKNKLRQTIFITFCALSEVKGMDINMKADLNLQKHNSKRKLRKRLYSYLWTKHLYKKAGAVGKSCKANAHIRVTKNTYIGEHSNFNGMKISGSGKVMIGSWFHSGEDIHIITDVHNYEGEAIPYDETDVVKDVVIDDFVWIGSHVIILGGVHIGKGAIIQAGSCVVRDTPPMQLLVEIQQLFLNIGIKNIS